MDSDLKRTIQTNIEQVNERIIQTAQRAGRDPASIGLVAVTKQKSAVVVKTLLDCGIHRIGESYLKEALFKIDLLSDLPVEWHMIGNIQSGKEKKIAKAFDCVHSVGGLETARELSEYAAKIPKELPVYLELNVSGEDTKGGWAAGDQTSWSDLLPDFLEILDMPGLRPQGLMTMAPYSDNPENARPYFRTLRNIRDYLGKELQTNELAGLSMGMSGDFEAAIEEGATLLRIGSALVGPRE